ncbi:MAG: lamin tail domain-containing protein [Verrucomicrobium sp.]|nr:lamin tail domain-containing protein [Verrucomicrobium sp.]
MRSPLLAALCLSLLPSVARAQVRLSEFLASNTRSHPDIVDFGDYPDWIELENPSDAPVPLAGWFLSDDPKKPLRWPLPPDAVLPPRGFLVVWADGEDALAGESHPRGYWPWRHFTTEAHHANFSLSALGESVVLTRTTGATNLTFIQPGVSRWRYRDDGTDGRPGPANWATETAMNPRCSPPPRPGEPTRSPPTSGTPSWWPTRPGSRTSSCVCWPMMEPSST